MLVSTSYFPPVLHYAWLLQNRDIFVEQYETFPKQTFRNRCVILSARADARREQQEGRHRTAKPTATDASRDFPCRFCGHQHLLLEGTQSW